MGVLLRYVSAISVLLFPSANSYAQGANPFFVPPSYPGAGQTVTADFNGDGKPDLIFADGTVLLGKGDGTFTVAAALSVTGDSIAAGDFNGDGKADVIVTSNSSTVLSVLLGNGDGTFQAALTVNVGAALKSVVVGDFNGDGKLDVAGVNDTSGLFVLIGAGNGSFSAASGSPMTLAPSSLIVAGDFNGDGKTDLAYGSSSGSSTATAGGVFLGNGDGTFKKGSALTIGLVTVSAVGAADLTGTGKLDLVFSGSTNSGPQTVVLVGHGDGTFQASDSSLAANGAMAITDLNGDRKPDLILDDDNVTWVFVGIGDGTFSLQNTYLQDSALKNSRSVVAADFNGDGKVDIATKNLMLLGHGDGSLQGNDASVFAGSGVTGGVVGDFNGDGSPDVVTSDGSDIRVLLNDGTGKFIQAHSYPSSAFPIAAADLNHDGKLDVVLVTTPDNDQTFTLNVMFGNGDGTFGTAQSTGVSGLTSTSLGMVHLVDLNGDQIPDLVVLTAQGANVFLGKGDGTFSAAVNYFGGSTPTTLQVGDFNNDGKQDIAVGSAAGIGVLLGKGDGTFSPAVLSGTGQIGFAAVGDVNGDGKLDLIGIGSSLTVFLGNGDGTFQAPLSTATSGPINGFATIATADVDGDGKLDVVASTGVWFVRGNGDGTFQTPINVLIGGNFVVGPFVAAVADFNGDGRPDVLITTAAMEPEQGFATFLNVTGSTVPGFTMAATAVTPGSVAPGGNAAAMVTVTPANGFTANVALSCVGLPAGSSCAFAPASTAGGSFASALTINVGSAAAGGTYYVGVVGTGGGLTHSRLLTLDVTATPDFALSAGSGGSATVAAGTTATYALSLAGSGGFSGSVALSCSGAPTGAACTISPASVTLNGSTAATATVSVTTTAASHVWLPGGSDRSRRIKMMLLFIYVTAVLAIASLYRLRANPQVRWAPMLAMTLLLCVGLMVTSCGGGSSGGGGGGTVVTGTQAGTYTITVSASATSGSTTLTHAAKLTLVVQ
jgi:hypothetical protein